MSPTPIYAKFVGPTVEDVKRQKRIGLGHFGWRPRKILSRLPIALEDLPGTQWRNVHICALETVDHIAEDRYGKPGPDPEKHFMVMHSIGFWMPIYDHERFCILNWVRVDHLPPEDQVDWAIERVSYCRKEVARAESRLQRADDLNTRSKRRELEWKRQYLESARKNLRAITLELGMSLSTDVINAGTLPGDQLVMF